MRTMTDAQLAALLVELTALSDETEWVSSTELHAGDRSLRRRIPVGAATRRPHSKERLSGVGVGRDTIWSTPS